MKNLSIIILLFLLIGCSNVITVDESINLLEDQGYDIKIYEKESFFNINDINRIVVEKEEDVLYLATIYYLKNEEDAKKFFEIIYNIYMSLHI
jgi:hypothetical protein